MNLNGIYRDYLIANIEASKANKTSTSSLDDIDTDKIDFENIVSNQLRKVNDKQLEADKMTAGMISGEVDDLHEVMIATEEARLSLELAVQLRNKCVEAFKELSNMQL